jgi:hypothetical protein
MKKKKRKSMNLSDSAKEDRQGVRENGVRTKDLP